MCTICKILHYICTKEKHTNQTKSYEIHKRKTFMQNIKKRLFRMHSLHLPFVSPTEIGGKTIIFYSYCNTSAPPVICNTCLNRGKNCKQITLPPDYENKHNKLKNSVQPYHSFLYAYVCAILLY